MGSVIVAIASLALLVAVAFAFWWQENHRTPEREVVYGVEDALDFVMARLSEKSRLDIRRNDARRILEWELRYLQDPAIRSGAVAVVGGLEAAQFAQDQALAQGFSYDGDAIIEVLDLQAAYLGTLGAVGEPVSAEEGKEILERYEETQ